MRETIDFVFNLHNIQTDNKLDKYSKFVAFSNYTNLTNQFDTRISFRIVSDNNSDITKLEDVELLAQDISSKESGNGVLYLYESTSHLALAYIALYDLIRNSTKLVFVKIVEDTIYKVQVKKFIVIYLI